MIARWWERRCLRWSYGLAIAKAYLALLREAPKEEVDDCFSAANECQRKLDVLSIQ